MKEINNWLIILQKSELYDYLPLLDRIQLSLVNKLIRERLKSNLFRNFNIIKYFKVGYRDRIEKELELLKKCKGRKSVNKVNSTIDIDNIVLTEPFIINEYLREFKSNLTLPHKHFIQNLKFNQTIPIQFINLSISELFPNITMVEFNRVKIPFSSILNFFNNSKKLEHLNLNLVGIIKFKSDNYTPSDLVFPSSLMTLKFIGLDLIQSKADEYPKLFNYDYIRDIETVQEIDIHPQSLPKLKNFHYSPRLLSSLPFDNQKFLKFLHLNKTIKDLETLPKFFELETIKEINSTNKLTKLKLGAFLRNSKIPDNSYSQLNTIINLDLHLSFLGRTYVEKISKLLPNVMVLSIYCHYSSLQSFNSMFSNFPKLVQLTIKSKDGISTSLFKNLNLSQLRTLTLSSEIYAQYELSDLDHFPNLNQITIEYQYYQGFGGYFLTQHYDKFNNWKYYFNFNRIQCYKKL